MDRSVMAGLDALALHSTPLAMLGLLEKTERWSRAELERHQLLRLDVLFAHARATVPFYAAWTPPTGEWTFERLRELPILRREEVRERATELRSTNAPRGHAVVREANSSGSTGRHVTVQVDAATAQMGLALSLRDAAWHGRDPRLKAAAIRAFPSGADAPHGRTEERWLARPDSGPACLLDIHTPVDAQLEWLQREAPVYVATYASNAAALIDRAGETGARWPGLREVAAFGEVLPEGMRDACRRVWDVPLVDAYSCVELGYLALECPLGGRYHVQSEHVLVEVLREDGSACDVGETGRVVVTALHAFAMPLLRYDIGDHAVAGGPCACGRGLPVLERVVGRSRSMIRLPSGDRLWPRFGSHILGGRFPAKQFRLRQLTLTDLVLELVPDRPFTPEEERALRDFVLAALRYPFTLAFAYVNDIPRSPGGKFEDVVSDVPG